MSERLKLKRKGSIKKGNMPVVRKTNFDIPKDLKMHWFVGNPYATHLANAFNIIFPDGERFFIRSVKAFADQVTDPELQARIKAFIGQEIQHGKAHEGFWQVMKAQGLPVDEFVSFLRKTAIETMEPNLNKIFGPKLALSITVALEHYTAVMAEQALENNIMTDLPGDIRPMFEWHAAEEIEHKSVAFDVLQQVDDNYFLRTAGMLIGTSLLFTYGTIGQIMFLNSDQEYKQMPFLEKLSHIRKFIKRQSGQLGANLFDYFRPGFHPNDHNIEDLAEKFFKKHEELFKVAS